MEFKTKNFTFTSTSDYDITLSILKELDDFLKIKIHINFGQKITPEPTVIRWHFPCCDIFSQWNPSTWFNHNLQPNWWAIETTSRAASWLPVKTHLSLTGENRLTVALSDCLTPLQISSGIVEETAALVYKLTLFTQKISAISEYETELIIDTRALPYYDILNDVHKYWESLGFVSASYPEEAVTPMYSSWYAYHQNLDRKTLIEELKLAKEYGMKSVIVDDGWQTTDSNRGYSYCGDWEAIRIPDMKELVDDVHSLGMKYIMWYSVPFVGKYSKAWKKFEGKFLNAFDEKHPWCCLDPRYPDVRDYLISIYEKAVTEWGFDGLKLDFIDSFELTEYSSKPNKDMDYESLEDAICALLKETKERLLKINPDILIEFRQSYVGPLMCTYGNMIRVADCPVDPLKNRVGSVHLRMTSGSSPVHSDMLLWNYNDTTESAALEMINIMFCVPQISVLIEKLKDEHKKMLKFYLNLWLENRDCLLSGHLTAKNPEANYSLVYSQNQDDLVAVSYSKNVLDINKSYKKLFFINGSWDKSLLINNEGNEYRAIVTIYDCMGNVVCENSTFIKSGYNVFDVPNSGVLKIVASI